MPLSNCQKLAHTYETICLPGTFRPQFPTSHFSNQKDYLYPVQFFDLNSTGEITIAYDYQTQIYSESEISAIHQRILYIMEQILQKETILLNKIEIVTPSEKQEILALTVISQLLLGFFLASN